MTCLVLVVLGPVVATVVYTYPMLGVGGLVGLLARPSLRLSRRVTRHMRHVAEQLYRTLRVARSGGSLEAGAE